MASKNNSTFRGHPSQSRGQGGAKPPAHRPTMRQPSRPGRATTPTKNALPKPRVSSAKATKPLPAPPADHLQRGTPDGK